MATTKPFEYVQTLTDQDIIEQARIVAEASKKIQEIKEAQRKIKDLQQKIITHSKYIQEGAIKEWTRGVFEWHKPSVGKVTVSYDQSYGTYFKPFEPFTRDMTEQELQDHCELEIPFEQEEGSEQKTFLHTVVHPYMIEYNKSALAFVVSIENNGRRDFLRSFLKFEEALDFVNQRRELEKPNDASVEANKSLLEEIIETNNEEILELCTKDEEDDEDISEIFGVTTIDDPPQPDSTPTPEPESTPEDPAPAYRIEQCESTKYPWNILKGSDKDAVIYERFRTKEEAENFMQLIRNNNIPVYPPGGRFSIEKVLGGWKIKECEYENGKLTKHTFLKAVTCYWEAREMCDEGGTLWTHPSEMKIVSENDRYQIVETPDGSLKTILKTTTDECIPDEEMR